MENIGLCAASLLDGGWTSKDRDLLIAEYGLTPDEADCICNEMYFLENDL